MNNQKIERIRQIVTENKLTYGWLIERLHEDKGIVVQKSGLSHILNEDVISDTGNYVIDRCLEVCEEYAEKYRKKAKK
ncbi:MAG: hypothetical protein LUD47_04130 [Clostridia bacterium]|nr:hypothetical protein [Clostridia bacterium]